MKKSIWHYVKGSPDPYTTFAWVGLEAAGVHTLRGETFKCEPSEGQVSGQGPFSAEQWIEFLEADEIRLFVKGGDKARNNSVQEILIKDGSIKDYYGAAYGGEAAWLGIKHGGFVQQKVGMATGKITLSLSAMDNEHEPTPNVMARTEIAGGLEEYSARAQVARFAGEDLVEAELNYEALRANGFIEHVQEARSRDGDWARCRLNISQGKLISLGGPCLAKIDGKDWAHTIAELRAEVDPILSDANYSTSYRNPGITSPISTFNKIPGREVVLCRARQP